MEEDRWRRQNSDNACKVPIKDNRVVEVPRSDEITSVTGRVLIPFALQNTIKHPRTSVGLYGGGEQGTACCVHGWSNKLLMFQHMR